MLVLTSGIVFRWSRLDDQHWEVLVRLRIAVTAILGAILVAGFATPALAQPGPAVRIAGGLSFLRVSNAGQTAKGVAADVAFNFVTGKVSVGAVGDVGVNSFAGCKEKSFAAGGRITGNTPTVSPFGQFLIGKANCGGGDSETIWQPGFGIDVKLNDVLDFRGQFDIRVLRFIDENINEQRFWFGVSIKIG